MNKRVPTPIRLKNITWSRMLPLNQSLSKQQSSRGLENYILIFAVGLLYRPSQYGTDGTYRSDSPSRQLTQVPFGTPQHIIQTDMYHVDKSPRWAWYPKWPTIIQSSPFESDVFDPQVGFLTFKTKHRNKKIICRNLHNGTYTNYSNKSNME